ncbi:MAG: tetratricopeptide repeat protein, partial [Phycisphaerae bacterium]|nr:tetratricopeptide repeat protein [Phycisphaerae bacterium]
QAKSGGRIDAKMLELAAAESDKILARNAALYEAAAQRAGIELDKGDMQGAIGVLERFLVAQPQDDAARSRLIALYREFGNRTKAVDLARAAADGAPYRADWREMLGDLSADNGDFAGAAAAYERAFQIQPQVHILVAKAIDARLAAGTPQAGITFLQTTPPDTQSNAVVRASQAAALAKLGRMAEAIAVAKESIAGARAAGINSVVMQQVLPRLRKIYGNDKTQELEDLLTSTGQPNASEKVLLGSIWNDTGAANAEKAIKWADSAIAEGSTLPPGLLATAHTLRGNALYMMNDLPGAAKEYFKAAEYEPDSPQALNNAAYISAEAGEDLARSMDLAERAVGLVPERAEFVDTLGYVLYLQAKKTNDDKMMQRAEEVLKRSLQLRGGAAALMHLGMVQAATGRNAEAKSSFDKARREPGVTPEQLKQIDDAVKALN